MLWFFEYFEVFPNLKVSTQAYASFYIKEEFVKAKQEETILQEKQRF